MAYKIFIDTNVFLDVFLQRTQDWQNTELVLRLANRNMIEAYTSSNNLVNIIYALNKQKLTQKQVIELIELTLTYTQLSDISKTVFIHALRAGFNDLEDAVQYYTALQIKDIDYFITSNTKDYKKATLQLPVLTAKQFMALYNKK